MKKLITFCLFLLSISSFSQNRTSTYELLLNDNWVMQSADDATASGSEIASAPYEPKNWYAVSVPTTIVAGLLANHYYDFDPFFGRNLEKLSNPRFDHPWWFRKTFTLPASEKGKNVILQLHGINYKANVWLNGQLIADSTAIKGPFRIFDLDVTNQVNYTGKNVLVLQITRPFDPNKRNGDLAIDYADWIHYPPDYNGGIINDVKIKTYDKVGITHPLVTTHFDLPSLSVAHLTVDADVQNFSNTPQDAVVKGTINQDITFEQKIHLQPGEKAPVTFTPDRYPQLHIKNPRIWWPWQYGAPDLNHIELSISRNGQVSNRIAEDFGIREMTSRLINNQSREFIVNGQPILLRGAAWSPDIFQRRSEERQEQEIKLVRDMNLNLVRSEGKMEDDHFYDLCDHYGLLVMTGWMCCGAWQYPENWDAAERQVAMSSDSSVMYWLRNKASLLVWLNGSDMPPRDTSVERDWLTIEKNLKWPNPVIATADASVSKVSGHSGVKMSGPYDWVPPIYWETDANKRGGAWSLATEISPGPSIPPYESLVKFLPADSMWYTTALWRYHAGTMTFGSTHIFDSALNERYGTSASIKEYTAKAQAQDYEGHRAMMEAYGLQKYHTATGVIQWMLSNPWPGLIWHTYDYYLYPAGTYFGIKKSLQPLQVMYSYADDGVHIVNSLLQPFTGLQVKATVYNLDGTVPYTHTAPTNVDPDSVTACFNLPAITGLSDTYFLQLQLADKTGKEIGINWYWLSKKKDELAWSKSKWYYTPQASFTDYTALQRLPKTPLQVQYTTNQHQDSTTHTITLSNPGKAVAFFVHLRALKSKGGGDILPVFFDDNYLLLAPGESRTIQCRYANKDAAGVAAPYIVTTAWNIDTDNSKASSGAGFEAAW